jgi:hypothetical protein
LQLDYIQIRGRRVKKRAPTSRPGQSAAQRKEGHGGNYCGRDGPAQEGVEGEIEWATKGKWPVVQKQGREGDVKIFSFLFL